MPEEFLAEMRELVRTQIQLLDQILAQKRNGVRHAD